MFSDDKSPTPDSSTLNRRAGLLSPAQQHMDHPHAPMAGTDGPFQDVTAEEEDFPTAPLDDSICLEDPVPDRHLCIHKQSQPYFLCSYPYAYSLDLPPPALEDTPASYCEMIDLGDISDFQVVMTTTSNRTSLSWMMFLDFEHGLQFG